MSESEDSSLVQLGGRSETSVSLYSSETSDAELLRDIYPNGTESSEILDTVSFQSMNNDTDSSCRSNSSHLKSIGMSANETAAQILRKKFYRGANQRY